MSDPNVPDGQLDRFFLATGATRLPIGSRPATVVPAAAPAAGATPSLNRKFSSLTADKLWVDKVRGRWTDKG